MSQDQQTLFIIIFAVIFVLIAVALVVAVKVRKKRFGMQDRARFALAAVR